MDKYGLTKDDFLDAPTKCYDDNGEKQLTDPFGAGISLDPKARCVFNVLVCDLSLNQFPNTGIIDACVKLGVDV